MKRMILLATMLSMAVSGVDAQVAAPAEVTAAAVAAVKAMGDQVVLGRHQEAIKRMYPQWKESVAKREGNCPSLD